MTLTRGASELPKAGGLRAEGQHLRRNWGGGSPATKSHREAPCPLWPREEPAWQGRSKGEEPTAWTGSQGTGYWFVT